MEMDRPLHCIAIEAKSAGDLDKILENLSKFLVSDKLKEKSLNFSELCYHLNKKYAASNSTETCYRAVIICKNIQDAKTQLQEKQFLRKELNAGNLKSKVAFLFTGQGSQYPAMGRVLYRTSPVFREGFDKCADVVKNNYGVSICQAVYGFMGSQLNRTIYSQTAIFCVEYALLELWKSWGVKPAYALGHSLGEYSAAVAAGLLDFEDAIKLVAQRSKLIEDLPKGKMLVVRSDLNEVNELLAEEGVDLDVAAINSKDQTVLSGESGDIERFERFAKAERVFCMQLEATHAFHSKMMDGMLNEFEKTVVTCNHKSGNEHCGYVSGMNGKLMKGPLEPKYWLRHTREAVNFQEASKALKQTDCELFVECGPQPILVNMVKLNLKNFGSQIQNMEFLPSLKKGADDWTTILGTLAKLWVEYGVNVDWQGFDKDIADSKLCEDFENMLDL